MEPKRKQYLYVNEAMRNKTNNKEHCLKTQQLKKDEKICYLAIMTKDRQDVLLLLGCLRWKKAGYPGTDVFWNNKGDSGICEQYLTMYILIITKNMFQVRESNIVSKWLEVFKPSVFVNFSYTIPHPFEPANNKTSPRIV